MKIKKIKYRINASHMELITIRLALKMFIEAQPTEPLTPTNATVAETAKEVFAEIDELM